MIIQNPNTGEYIIVDSKYNSSTLSVLSDGTPQMSHEWIEGARLEAAVGQDLAQDIIDTGYTSVVAKVKPDGSIVYKQLDSNGSYVVPNTSVSDWNN